MKPSSKSTTTTVAAAEAGVAGSIDLAAFFDGALTEEAITTDCTLADLAEIYDDPTWKVYDEDGNVLSTDTSEKFNDLVTGGPQADADAGPVNLCVYGENDWADGGGPIAAFDAELGYHYHANRIEKNAVLSCLSGVTTEAEAGDGGGGPPGGGGAAPGN